MTDRTAKTAPEIKAVPETMAAAFDDFMEAFEAFKDTNDRRLGEIERSSPTTSSPATRWTASTAPWTIRRSSSTSWC
jgi:predicted phage gp36 major capsid-like protein